MRSLRYKQWLIPAALTFTVGWFALLAKRPLYEPDEGRYAEIPREMLHGGDWVIPHLNGLAYLEKPPLQYWISALVLRCCGESEAAARLCTGLAGYVALALVVCMAYRLWGFRAAVKAALMTAASSLFFLLGHQLTLDMTLTCCLLGALACFMEAQLRRAQGRASGAWMSGCWAAMALAVLTKGLIGLLIPGVTLGLYALWQRDLRILKTLQWSWGLPVFGAIAVPWFFLAARENADFLRFFFIREHFQRFFTPIEHRTEPWWFFGPILILGTLPWVAQAVRGLATGWRATAPPGEFDARRVLWIWTAFVLVFFSCSDAKLIPYILPALPTLALLCAHPRAGDGRFELWVDALVSLAAAVAILAYAGGALAPRSGLPLALTLAPVLVWTSSGLACAVAGCTALLIRNQPRAALAVLCVGWVWTTGTILIGADRAASFYSAKDLAVLLRRQPGAAPPGSLLPVYSVQSYEQSLPFYLGRTVVLVDYRDELDFGLRADPARGIASLEQFAALWRGLEGGYAVMPLATQARLAGLGFPMREIGRFADRAVVSRR